MRMSFVLPATMVIAAFVTCNAAADSDQTKISVVGSPDLVRSLDGGQIADDADKRFLREHKVNGTSNTEERVLNEWRMKRAVKKLAEELLLDATKETTAFTTWENAGHTLDKIKKRLKIDEGDKYLQIYNGYVNHMYQM